MVALFLVLALAGPSFSSTGPDSGKPGGPGGCSNCRLITVSTKYHHWGQKVTWAEGPIESLHAYSIWASQNTWYYLWKNGTRDDKIAPFKTQICYEFITDGRGSIAFDGLKGLARYRDDDYRRTIGTIRVNDNGDKKNCKSYTIPVRYRHWMPMGLSPEVSGTGSVVRHLMKDLAFRWRGRHGSTVHYFHPLRDYTWKGPHKIIKEW